MDKRQRDVVDFVKPGCRYRASGSVGLGIARPHHFRDVVVTVIECEDSYYSMVEFPEGVPNLGGTGWWMEPHEFTELSEAP
jgi:hypothetical protein